MSYVNNYHPAPKPELPEDELWGPEPYDINFAYPIHLDTLQSERVKVVPFVPREHAPTYWAHVKDVTPDLCRYYPFAFSALAQFLAFLETRVRPNPLWLFLAVLDRTRPDPAHPEWGGSLAGVQLIVNTSAENLSTELGFVLVFPAFQRTHVASNMVGLAFRYLLQLPTQDPPGLGFRRVVYTAHPRNVASKRLAERMGCRLEGCARYVWVLADALAREGEEGRVGDAFSGQKGRHADTYALCFDDWEGGGREVVQAQIDRK